MAEERRRCYGPPLVRGFPRTDGARAGAVVTCLLLLAAVPVALAADASGLRSQAAGLRAASGTLDARAKAATLELYSIEARLGAAQAELDRLAERRSRLAAERASARKRLAVARKVARVSEARLAELVRALYEQPGQKDPLAVILGARSLEEAMTGLDNLDRAAAENVRIAEQARRAKARLGQLDAQLARRDAALARLVTTAQGHAAQLAAAAAERRSFVAALRREQGLTAARVASIEAQARAAEVRSARLSVRSAPPASTPSESSVAPAPAPQFTATSASGGRTLTVSATGYALRGRTATGIETAPGVVAVDPSVIPLGTRMTIPGYGEGIAADTGGAVHGNIIDLWFPTTEQALAWGRRTVTITLH